MANSGPGPHVDPSVEPIPSDAGSPTRRRVLTVSAVAGAAVLAGCGSGGSETAKQPAGGAGSGGSTGSSGETSGGAGTKLVATSKVPVKGGVILDEAKVVVTQPSEGTFEAFTAVCTHMQCLVGMVADNVISCPCHGSAYSAKDGSVQQGPATRPLAKVPIKVDGGEIVEA